MTQDMKGSGWILMLENKEDEGFGVLNTAATMSLLSKDQSILHQENAID